MFLLLVGGHGLLGLPQAASLPAGLRMLVALLATGALAVAALRLSRDAAAGTSSEPETAADGGDQARIDALNEELQARLESLATLAGGIAHDFNNLLTVITGHADLMASGEKSPTRAEHLASIRSAAERAAGLTRQMLAYSGRGHFLHEPTDLNACIDPRQLGDVPDIAIAFELAEDLPALQLAPDQIRQLVEELVRNAIEATVEGGELAGRVTVRTRRDFLDAEALAGAAFEHDLAACEHVILEIADNGAGMAPEVAGRLFEPYYSTRFDGRGLGMAAVAGIVRGHDAALFLDTAPGAGTRVRIAFAVAGPDTPTYRGRAHRGETARILVLDDEPGLLELAREYAERLGLEAIVTDDPDEAVELLLTEGERIDAVLLDYLMPLRTGDEVLAEIREFSSVDVYLTSGFSRGRVDDPELRSELAGFLQKPYTFEDFRRLFAAAPR